MRIKLWMIVAACLMFLVVMGCFVAFTAESADDLLYFPLKVGSEWVYKVTAPDKTSYQQNLIVFPDTTTPKIGVLVNGNPVVEIHFNRNEQGLYKTKEISSEGVKVLDPQLLLLSSKLTVGSGWKWQSANTKAKMDVKIMNGGKITVTAGTFDTILVHTEGIDEEGTAYIDESWYAKGIGYVKSVITTKGLTREEDELLKYIPGK